MKEEALKLADELDATKVNGNKIGGMVKASAMIRRLVEELDKQWYMVNKDGYVKPLSDEEIHDIWKSLWEGGNIGHIAYNYARAIEERHGIK